MKAMGLDLSLSETGFSVLEDGKSVDRGTIGTVCKGTARLRLITDEVLRHVDMHKPDAIAIEGVAYNSTTAVDSAELHGAVRVALARAGHPEPLQVAPPTLKKFCTGDARAQKSDIKLEIFKRWKVTERNDNKADAYVLSRMAAVNCGMLKAENESQRQAIVSANTTTGKKEGRIARFKKKKKKEESADHG